MQFSSCNPSREMSAQASFSQLGKLKQTNFTPVAQLTCDNMRLTDAYVQSEALKWLFIVASFPDHGEPLIHGFGVTADQSWQLAKFNRATQDAVLCARQAGDSPRWLSALGKEVTIAHVTARKAIK